MLLVVWKCVKETAVHYVMVHVHHAQDAPAVKVPVTVNVKMVVITTVKVDVVAHVKTAAEAGAQDVLIALAVVEDAQAVITAVPDALAVKKAVLMHA